MTELKNANSEKQKVQLYSLLCAYYRNRNPDSLLNYASRILEIGYKTNNNTYKGEGYKFRGLAFQTKSDHKRSSDCLDSSISLFTQQNNKVQISECYHLKGITQAYTGDYKSSLDLF